MDPQHRRGPHLVQLHAPPDPIPPQAMGLGPLYEVSDGRWAVCAYAWDGAADGDALVIWSEDLGKSWGDPIAFPAATDRNRSMTEVALVELGPGSFLAAIRSDTSENGGFDGFYFSRSADGVKWSAGNRISTVSAKPGR